MRCDEVMDRLDDYVDGELPEALDQDVELHVADCSACRREERALRALIAHADALPEELAPPRDLWADIAPRLDPARRSPTARAWWWMPMGLAAAAAVAVAVSVLVLGRAGRDGLPPANGTLQPAAAVTTSAAMAGAERDYARAAAELLAALEHEKANLSPETVRSIEQNLQTIDDALAQVRAALRTDPSNPELAHMLAATHRKKLDTLQRVVRLSRL